LQCQKRQLSCPGYQKQLRWAPDYRSQANRSERNADKQWDEAVNNSTTHPVAPARDSNHERTGNLGSCGSLASPFDCEEGDSTSPVDSRTERAASIGLRANNGRQIPHAVNLASASNPNSSSIRVEEDPSRPRRFVLASSQDAFGARGANESQFLPYWSRLSDTEAESTSSIADGLIETPESLVGHDVFQTLTEEDRFLLRHYFTDVCRLNSAFDSPSNPFRYMIAELLSTSPLILNCVINISARWEVQRNRKFMPTAVRHHSAAVGHLSDILHDIRRRDASLEQGCIQPSSQQEYSQIKQAILASILLGISSVGPQSLLSAMETFHILFSK
jgi:hypothetical protein